MSLVLLGSSCAFASINSSVKRRCTIACAALDGSSAASGDSAKKFYLPNTLEESIGQARMAYKAAIEDGYTRLQLEMLIPSTGATDLDDWPGGIQQQYQAAVPIVSALLSGDDEPKNYMIDKTDGVGAWENENVALILFPTADTITSIQSLANGAKSLLLMNVQWRDGQVISDFGFGADKIVKEDFVKSFLMVYYLQQLRILGNNVRVFKRYPGSWQVFITDSYGESECIAVEPEKPSYKRLELVLKEAKGPSSANNNWLSRLFQELKFNADSMK